MSKRLAFVVAYIENNGQPYIDGVIGQRSKADERVSEIEKWKWVKRAWYYPLNMNEIDQAIPIKNQ